MTEEQEEQVENSESQVIEGYGCSCGFRTEDMIEFRTHVMLSSGQDGKGTHTSVGRVNMQTGEVVMPPWKKRTKEQQQRSTHGKHKRKVVTGSTSVVAPPIKTTDILSGAQELRFVPRIYTTDYSPIMRAAQEAAVEFWGWPADMPFGDFLDTALHLLFREHGITLAGYSISEEAREALQVEKERREQEERKEKVEEGVEYGG